MKISVLKPALLALCVAMGASGQGLSGIFEAIDKLDKKLTKLIGKEAEARKAEDAKIRKQMDKSGGVAQAPDSGLIKEVEALVKAVEELKSAENGLKEKVVALENEIGKLSEKPGDERVKELAVDLKVLVDELKETLSKKEEHDNTQTSGAETGENEKAMDVGGLVTLDWGGAIDHLDSPHYGVGEVELAANVYITEDITASVALLSEGDPNAIAIDQAIAVYENQEHPLSFIFGLQTLNHGLLSTHLISDPSIIDNVELAVPGITVNYALQKVTLGAGFTIFQDAPAEGEDHPRNTNHAGVFNLDFDLMEESPVRLSTLLSQDIADLDAAATLSTNGLSLDVEGYTRVGAPKGEGNTSGYFVGIAYGVNDHLEIAARHDGLSGDAFKDMDFRFAGGLTVHLPHDFYCALELSHMEPNEGDSKTSIEIQLGMEATVPLPGFQRRTLKRH